MKWTKYDSQKLLAVTLLVVGWVIWPKDKDRPKS